MPNVVTEIQCLGIRVGVRFGVRVRDNVMVNSTRDPSSVLRVQRLLHFNDVRHSIPTAKRRSECGDMRKCHQIGTISPYTKPWLLFPLVDSATV